MMKKILSLILSCVLMLSCAAVAGAEENGVTIEYPEDMQALGFTEPVVLPQYPEKVVCLNASPVMTLYKLGVNMIGVAESSAVTYPEDLLEKAELLPAARKADFDVEGVMAMEPDLVFLTYTLADTAGKVLSDAGIPVYYVAAGHAADYSSVKSQTRALVDAFGKDSEAGKEILKSFDDLEARLADVSKQLKGKTVMVLVSTPPTHYIQGDSGVLGAMAKMIGLTNVYTDTTARMAELDYETTISYDPDLVLCVGKSKTGEEHKAVMEAEFAKNSEYWNSIPAIKDGNVLYLPVNYFNCTGINVVDDISNLADMVLAHFAK